MPSDPTPRPTGAVRVAADRRAQTADAILPALTAAAAVLLALAVLRAVTAPPQEVLVALVMGGTGAVLGAVRLACAHTRVRDLVRRHADEVGLAACLLASAPSFTELVVTSRPAAAGGLTVFLLATGTLLNDRRYSLVVTLVCLAQWLSVAAAQGFRDEWAQLTVVVLCAAVLARVLNALRCRAADELATAEVAILEAAVTDELTGLANRRGLLAAGAELVREAGPDDVVACLYLDLDGLKATNDRHGHTAGDALVRATATALLAVLRPQDVVARLGGDEFAALLPGVAPGQARDVARRLQQDLEDRGVSVSTGLAESKGDVGVEDLLATADAAMYAVKQHRRGLPQPRTAGVTAPRAPGPTGPDADPTAPGPGSGLSDGPSDGPTVHGPAVLDPAATSRTDVRDLTRVGVLLHLGVAPLHLLLLTPGQGPVMAGVSVVVAAAMAGLHLLTVLPRLRAWSGRRTGHLMCVAMLLLCGETVLYAHVVDLPWATAPVLLAIVAAGGTLVDRGQVVLSCLLTLLGWASVAVTHPGTWAWSGSAVLSAVLVAGLLHVTHQRTVDRMLAAQERVRGAALTDELTGLPNRRGFHLEGRALVELSLRRGEHVSVLYLDLDGLKAINDEQGHAAGDRLILTAAQVLRRSRGPSDVCARLGGDEFTVLLHGCPPAEVPGRVRWLHAALAAEQVQASIGVAHLPEHARTLEGLVHHADQAMLVVKQAHRRSRPEPEAQILGGRSS